MSPGLEKISVLYVDDESALLDLGKLFLESMGDFSITTIDSAVRALDLLTAQKFDLILSDYQMPGMDGIAFLKEVRSRFGDIPFILFTGKGREEVVVQAINNGADFYLQKGGDPTSQFSELAHKIRQAVRRKRAESGLAESRDYLKQIFSSVKAGIMVIDAQDHTIVDINPAGAEMIGLPHDEIVGKVCHRYVCPAECGKCPISDLGQVVDNSEKILLAADGRNVPIIKYVSHVTLGGRPRFLETFIDNTARKTAEKKLKTALDEMKRNQEEIQAAYSELAANEQILLSDYAELARSEQKIRESEAQYRLVFDSANDAIIIHEPEGSGKFIEVNVKACTMLGYSRDELLTMGLPDIDVPLQVERIPGLQKKVVSTGEAVFETELRRKDQLTIPVEVSARLIVLGGRHAILSIIRDISDRKRAETAMTLANKKLFMMNEVTRHEIKNLITGLVGCVDMAGSMTSGPERAEMNREIKHIVERIQQQIDFTKEYQEIGVKLPTWQNVQELVPSPAGMNIRISPQYTDLEIYADPLLAKIFVYLTENVSRHGVHATEISLSLHLTPQGLVLIFEDDGVGVPPERKNSIFTRKEGDRKGMGLFLVREILAITGITITEDGKFGSGARFKIFVPKSGYRIRHKR